MMASRVLSRFLPALEADDDDGRRQATTSSSTFRHDIAESDQLDRFRDHFDEHELDNMLLDAAHDDLNQHESPMQSTSLKLHRPSSDHDHNVPASLLMETEDDSHDQQSELYTDDHSQDSRWSRPAPPLDADFPQRPSVIRPSRVPVHPNAPRSRQHPMKSSSTAPIIDHREQALWRWINVTNVDGFLLQVYEYYTDHGIWSIILARLIRLLTTAFLFSLYIFLSSCVDYKKVPHSNSTKEILIPHCIKNTSFVKNTMIWVFVFWSLSSIARYVADVPRLWHLHQFYHYLLDIPDTDMQTIPWERVVEGLMNLRDSNPETAEHLPPFLRAATATATKQQSKQRMDAHDIANRLMRRDNYYIAMIDKHIIDFSLPVPFLGMRDFYSKSLEWCISVCFENFIFDQHGHVQQSCLDIRHRQRMIYTLRRRLRFAAVISVLMAPFNIGAHCVYYFSRYYAEFRNSPAQLGARAFTPLAEWKMRDFNELDHDLRHRIKMAYPFADRYLNQFPKDKMDQALQFVGLITGTVAAILGIATLLDPELFLGFEVTPGRTAFFYLSISMGIFAATRNAVPDDDQVNEPVIHLFEAIRYTHYCPQRWKRQLHSNLVRAEFSVLYQTKILIFAQELLSLIVAPFILWRNSGPQSSHIIDFFRQFTVHVDGLGGLCNYAVFDFRKRTTAQQGDKTGDQDTEALREEILGGRKDNKMAMSQYYFMQRLGQYDQQQASRYQRQIPAAMPPLFPPLTPLDEVSNAQEGVPDGTSKHRLSTHAAAPSPHQSLLLDLHHKRIPLGRSMHGRRSVQRQQPAGAKVGLEVEDMHDLTTSRLIEQDVDLADSWKLDRDEGMNDDIGQEAPTRRGGGVLDLLVEYSKAHADGSGRRTRATG